MTSIGLVVQFGFAAMAQLLRVGLVAVIEACQVGVNPHCLPILRMPTNHSLVLHFPNKSVAVF